MQMNRHHHLGSTTRLLAAVLLAGTLFGCQGNNQREEWVEDADNRWLNLRSTMMLNMAQQQFETGDLELAEQTVHDAMEIDPSNASLHVLGGRIAMENGELERSYHDFSRAQELDEENAESHYYQGLVLQRWQRYEAAAEAYERAYELRPDRVGYLLAVSEMKVELEDLDAALSMLHDRLDYFEQNASIRAQLGYIYNLQGHTDRAVGYLEEAALMVPEDQKLRGELGLTQFAAGDHEGAIETLEALLDAPDAPDRRDLRRTLARAYVQTQRHQRARQTYLELARSPQGEASDWVEVAQLAWRAGDLSATLQAAHQVIERAPQRYEGYQLAGMVWHERRRLEDALEMFDRAAELDQSRTEPLIMRGMALQRAGRSAEARTAYETALERDPQDRRAQRLLRALDAAAAAVP